MIVFVMIPAAVLLLVGIWPNLFTNHLMHELGFVVDDEEE